MTYTHKNFGTKISKNFDYMLVRENEHNFVNSARIDLIPKSKERRLLTLQLLYFEFSQISTVGLSILDERGQL